MNIGILCGPVYPSASATGICALRIAKEFAKHNDVTIIGTGTDLTASKVTYIGGVRVINAFDKETKERLKYSTFSKNILSSTCCQLIRAKWILKFILQKNSVRKWLVEEYTKELSHLPEFDYLIAICCPFESMIASVEYCKIHTATLAMAYMFDEFVDARTTHYFGWNKFIKHRSNMLIEREIINQLDYIFFVHQNYNHMQQTYPDIFLKKMMEVEHPLIEKFDFVENTKINRHQSNKCELIYGGGLRRKHIDPTYFIGLLDKIHVPRMRLFFDIYTNPNAVEQFENIEKKHKSIVAFHNWVPRNELLVKLQSADILVSIAASDGHQISSKIFEYMSMCKPILHIYKAPNDSNLVYLKKYPLALCLSEKNIADENITELTKWLQNVSTIRVTPEFIEEAFGDCTAEYIANLFVERMSHEREKINCKN
jgi:hypothetical protein